MSPSVSVALIANVYVVDELEAVPLITPVEVFSYVPLGIAPLPIEYAENVDPALKVKSVSTS